MDAAAVWESRENIGSIGGLWIVVEGTADNAGQPFTPSCIRAAIVTPASARGSEHQRQGPPCPKGRPDGVSGAILPPKERDAMTASRRLLRWEQDPGYKAGKKRGAEWARERREDEPERVARVDRVARLNVDPSYEEVAAARVQKAAYPDDPAERAAERLWGRDAEGDVIEPNLPFVDGFVAGVREVARPP